MSEQLWEDTGETRNISCLWDGNWVVETRMQEGNFTVWYTLLGL